jgi:hypothetical protein
MSTTPGVVTAVRWNELCPWLLLVRAVRAALLVRVVVLAAIGVVVTQAGWSAIEGAVLGDDDPVVLARLTERPARAIWTSSVDAPPILFEAVDARPYSGPLVRGWAWTIQPLTWLAESRGWRSILTMGLAGIWAVAVWALVGGAIARIAALHLARGEAVGPVAALRWAAKSWPSIFAAPMFCICVIIVFSLLLMLGGFVMRLSFLAFLAGLVWPIALAIGIAVAVFAIGLIFGWPLMWSTMAVERTDAFDGVSRGYAYTFQRPLHLVFFVVVATVLGLLAQEAVNLVVGGSLAATHWAVERGLGGENVYSLALLSGVRPPEDQELGVIAGAGGKLVRFWTAALESLATAFPMAYLWPAATGIYLLLRRLIDSTEISEASVDESELEPGLPSLVNDPATGVPKVQPNSTEASATVTDLRGGST